MKYLYFAIVHANGEMQMGPRRAPGPRLYDMKHKAQAKALKPGDSVIEVVIDLDKEPQFIRGGFVIQ